MANAKYDNLVPMLASGKLNWPADRIQAFLVESAAFNTTHQRMSQVTGTTRGMVTMPERSVRPSDGAFLGYPVSFDGALANVVYSVVLAKEDGSQDPWLISYYDRDQANATIKITIAGTLTVRPLGSDPLTPGVWVDF